MKAWGRNASGQLGDGTTDDRSTPVTVSGLTNVKAVAAGADSTYALLSDGTVKAWGSNASGQLGDGTTMDSQSPVTVQGLTDGDVKVQAIAASSNSAYALLSNGTVKAWGQNFYGQLGDGTAYTRSAPVTVSDPNDPNNVLSGVKAIATSWNSAYALLDDGSVKAWGRNDFGQLGDGTTTGRWTPVTVSGLTNVQAVAGGWASGYALLNDGTVKAWGQNSSGQLGDGTIENRLTPVTVSGLIDVQAVAAGGITAYALLSGGTVKAWGTTYGGSLGNGLSSDSLTPTDVSGLTGVQAIAAGRYSGYALLSGGTVKSWGSNDNGQLGDGSTVERHTPVDVTGLTTDVQAIAAGRNSVYAIVAPTDTTTTLSTNQTLVTEGDEVTFTATVTPEADDKGEYFGGTLEFFNGAISLGTADVDDSTGEATFTTTALSVGEASVTAVFTPTEPSAFNSSPLSDAATLTVAARTATTLNADQTSVTEGDAVTLTATVAPAAAGTVEFKNGDTTLGTADTDANTGVATLTITALPAGTNSITAVFTPDDPTAFAPSTSDALTVTVAARETEPSSDNGGTSESDGETNSDTALPETGESDSPVEILSLISASLLAAGTALGIAQRRSVQ